MTSQQEQARVDSGHETAVLPDALVAQPGSRKERFLLYPTSSGALHFVSSRPDRRSAALAAHQAHTWRGRILKKLMAAGVAPARRLDLDADALRTLSGAVEGVTESSSRIGSIYAGTPGAYRKLTATVLGGDGRLRAVLRIPLDPLSEQAVRREAQVLAELASHARIAPSIPKLLATGAWGGRTVTALSPGPPGRGGSRLTPSHLAFLDSLHRATRRMVSLRQSGFWIRLHHANDPRTDLPPPWAGLLERAAGRLEATMEGRPLPISTAHGDFSPWNCRLAEHGLFVFDWEASLDEALPLFDVFHFCAVRCATAGRPLRIDRRVPALLASIWPDGSDLLQTLLMAYLAEIGLYYAKARALRPGEGSDSLLRWFQTELEKALAESRP